MVDKAIYPSLHSLIIHSSALHMARNNK